MEPLPEETDRVATEIVDATFKVHSALGPGLLESVYETCLTYELEKRGLRVQRQRSLPVIYDGRELDGGMRLDLIVEDVVIVELKAVEKLIPPVRGSASYIFETFGKTARINRQFQCLEDQGRDQTVDPMTAPLCLGVLVVSFLVQETEAVRPETISETSRG